MEGSHSVLSGPAQQDDSWTCQRCGWVYPNAHPSAKHRRNHKKVCGKVKGFELRSQLHKGGSSDEASSGDDSHAQKATKAGSAAPVVDHSNAPQSRDLLVNEFNVPDDGKSHTPFFQDSSASLDVKPEVSDNESTRDIINIDTVKIESSAPEPEPEPSIVPLDNTTKTFKEGQTMYATLVDRVEEPAHISPGSYADEAKEFVKDSKYEDPPIDLTTNKPLESVEEHSKPHAPEIDTVEAAVHNSTGMGSDQSSSAGAKSEGIPSKYTESVASLEVPLNISQDETKISLTPCLDKVEIAAHESQGLASDHVKGNDSLLISKEQGLHRQGPSQGDDSWTCHRCGWVYPNPHPSAKHRKKHKKQCGKVKGFELHTEPHNAGSSDEVSSDEDVHVKKEHVPHPPLQLLQPQEQANETVATESLPSIVDHSATFVEGESITESASNSLQSREFSAQVDAPDRELGDTPNGKEISKPDMVPSVVSELPHSVPFLDQQNLPAGDNKKDVSDEPDIPSPKELPKHSSMKEETPPNQACVQEFFKSSETQLVAVPSLPTSVDTLAIESHGDLGKDANVEHGSRSKFAEEPAGLLAECAPDAASIPSVSDFKSSDASPPVHFEDKGACALEVDEPNVVISSLDPRGAGALEVDEPNVVLSSLDPRGAGLSYETSDVPAGEGLNQIVVLKEEREKPGLSGLDTASNLDALDDTMANDPLRKEMATTMTGGSTGQLESETISSDLSSYTSPADKVPVENKSVTENLLPLTALSTANATGLANDANEEGRFLSMQTAANTVQLVPKNELLAQIGGVNDDAVLSTTIDKTDETPPVTNMEHFLDNQMASSTKGETDGAPPMTEAVLDNGMAFIGNVPKEVNIPAVTSGEVISIRRSLDESPSKDVLPVAEDFGQGETGGNTEYANSKVCIANDTGVADTGKESEVGGITKGISSAKDGEQEKTEVSGGLEAMVKPEAKEETPSETGGIESLEATCALEAMAKPEAKDETEGIGSSDLSYSETYSFTRSESGVTARSELGASHKLSDSLEIYEDAPDSLDTCSVGGSVEENESLDEPRQASDRLQEEPEHVGAVFLDERVLSESVTVVAEPKDLGAATLDEPVSGETVVVEQKSSVTNASRLEEASSEERASTLPGTSYGGKNKMEDLKAPSPEAWQEPGPSNVKSEGKKISTSEVTEDSKSGESHMALRSLMAKEVPDKAEPVVEASAPAGDVKSSNTKEGSVVSANGMKPKSRSFWRYCICCSTVH